MSSTERPSEGADPAPADQPGEHRAVWDSIAWSVAGTASAEQEQRLRAHLPHCAHCRAELALQQQIHQALQEETPADELAIQAGLAQLWAREDAQAALPPVQTLPPEQLHRPAANEGASRLTRWLGAAVAAQAFALCVLGLRVWNDSPPAADYQTLSQPGAAAASGSLRLIVREQLEMAQLRALLSRHELRIVGADEDGVSLVLAPLPTAAARSPAQRLERLRAEPDVLLAEPLTAGPGH